ncbi:MAG: amino acid permease [Paludibacteraceae bacterium]
MSEAHTSPAMQIKGAMAIVLWCFVGMEAGTVLSGRAKSQRTVRYATVISFLIVLAVYILITFVAMSSVSAGELLNSKTPLAMVLEKTQIGKSGAYIVQIGIMVSVVGAGLSWLLLSTETMYSAARSGVMPSVLTKENKNGTPINALLLSLFFTQFFLLAVFVAGNQRNIFDGYNHRYIFDTDSLLFFGAFCPENRLSGTEKRKSDFICSVAFVSTVYSAYVIYTVGMKYVFLAILFYALGAILFYKAKKEKGEKIKSWELLIMWLLILIALVIVYLLLSGKLTL